LDLDLLFTLGLLAAAFSIPAFVSALSDKRRPTMAVLMMLIGVGLVVYVGRQDPEAYSLQTVDEVVVGVVGRFVN